MNRKLLIFGLVLIGVLIFVTPVSAETQGLPISWNIPWHISGFVIDFDDSSIIIGASVDTIGASTTTNASGYYDLRLFNGSYTLTASKTGYYDNSTFITVTNNMTNINISLKLIVYVPGISNLRAKIGSTWILWSWNYSNSTTNASVYIDGKFKTNTTLEHYGLSDLNPREEHVFLLLDSTNSTNILGSDSTKTLYPVGIYYIMILVTFGFLILQLLFTKVNGLSILFGMFAFMFGITSFYFSFVYYMSMFAYLMVGVCAISVVWILGALFTMIAERRSYE